MWGAIGDHFAPRNHWLGNSRKYVAELLGSTAGSTRNIFETVPFHNQESLDRDLRMIQDWANEPGIHFKTVEMLDGAEVLRRSGPGSAQA